VAMQVEFFGGSKSRYMQALTTIGNAPRLNESDKDNYRTTVEDLMPFLSKGTTAAKQRMGIHKNARKVERDDDCGATGATVIGDKLMSDAFGEPTDNLFEVDQYAVLTLQAAVISIFMAENRRVPLLIRVGAASFGLDGSVSDLGYMRNIQPEMIALGAFTSGDFGEIMKQDGDETRWEPELRRYGHGSFQQEKRFFLSGGGPIMEMMHRKLRSANKAKQGAISILRAKRVDSGEGRFGKKPKDWALAISGIYFRYQPDYAAKAYLSMIE